MTFLCVFTIVYGWLVISWWERSRHIRLMLSILTGSCLSKTFVLLRFVCQLMKTFLLSLHLPFPLISVCFLLVNSLKFWWASKSWPTTQNKTKKGNQVELTKTCKSNHVPIIKVDRSKVQSIFSTLHYINWSSNNICFYTINNNDHWWNSWWTFSMIKPFIKIN